MSPAILLHLVGSAMLRVRFSTILAIMFLALVLFYVAFSLVRAPRAW